MGQLENKPEDLSVDNGGIHYPEIAGPVGLLVPPLPFSRVTRVDNLLFVSGQASIEGGVIVPGTLEEEFRRTLDNLRQILEATGSGLDRVVQHRSYVREASDVALCSTLYSEYFCAPLPAGSLIVGCLPQSIRFEMECIAYVE